MPDPRKLLEHLHHQQALAEQGGGAKRISQQHEKGKLTARERLDLLLDEGTFVEMDRFVTHRSTNFGLAEQRVLGDGVVTGYGRIDGRLVYVFSQDFTVFGGSLSEAHAGKICKVMDLAVRNGAPIIGLNDSGGARIQEGVVSLGGYADLFLRNTLASGVVPQLSAILGPCAGGAVYSPAITDFIAMVRGVSYMFVTGPGVVKTVTHEDVSFEELGGADVHASASGVAHFAYDSEPECMAGLRALLSFIPSNNLDEAPIVPTDDPDDRREESLLDVIPDTATKPYDMHEVIRRWLSTTVAFSRFSGTTPGTSSSASPAWVVARSASWPTSRMDLAGVPRHRRLRQGGALHPLLRLLSTSHSSPSRTCPASCPGPTRSTGGIIKHGAKLLYAYCEATVPKLTVITRKAYGGAYDVMSSKHIRGD